MQSISLDDEICALRSVFNQDTEFLPITERQLAGLNSLLHKGLTNPANRIPVVRMITGLKMLDSTRQLTLWTAHTLISEWKADDEWNITERGLWLIQACEERIKEQAGVGSDGGNGCGDEAPVPDMQQTN